MSFLNDDQRPAFVFDDIKGAELRFVKARALGGMKPITIKNSKDVNLFQSLNLPDGQMKN